MYKAVRHCPLDSCFLLAVYSWRADPAKLPVMLMPCVTIKAMTCTTSLRASNTVALLAVVGDAGVHFDTLDIESISQ